MVHFSPKVRAALKGDADDRHLAMAGKKLSYGMTTQARQFAGVLGEAGVLAWLSSTLPATFELSGDQPGGADVYVCNPGDHNGWTLVEVKTHDARFWRENGRLVNAQQLSRMSSDVIPWCVTPNPLGQRVVLAGWSPVQEVIDSGVAEMTGPFSNVRVHAPMRAPEQLSTWLASGRNDGWPLAEQ